MSAQGVIWKLKRTDRVMVSRELYAMDIREVARRMGISRGLVFVLEKSALLKLRRNGKMKELLELARLKNSLRSEST
jgi:DNA-directed RNA polymerase specialized sigma subunit